MFELTVPDLYSKTYRLDEYVSFCWTKLTIFSGLANYCPNQWDFRNVLLTSLFWVLPLRPSAVKWMHDSSNRWLLVDLKLSLVGREPSSNSQLGSDQCSCSRYFSHFNIPLACLNVLILETFKILSHKNLFYKSCPSRRSWSSIFAATEET